MNIIFFGTANISKTFLENIDKKHKVAAVITMPDKPAARGGKLKAPEVKIYAIENNIPYIQVDKFNDEVIKQIKRYNSDAGVAVSFGKIIPEQVFTMPKFGCFNIHFSLLPQYRGASPVQQALIDGQKQTGVTAFCIEKGLDTGDILLQESLNIEDTDTSVTLFDKLSVLGVSVMNKSLNLLEQGKCLPKKQTGTPAFCKILKKEDGKIDWNMPARNIYNLFRGLYLWPGIFCVIQEGRLAGKTLKIFDCGVVEDDNPSAQTGEITSVKKNAGFIVKCGVKSLLITQFRPESKSKMSAYDFLNGSSLKINSRFA